MSANREGDVRSSQKTLLLGLAITLSYAVIEAIGGWLANSLALLGDAGHMLTDAVSLAGAAFAAHLATRPPTKRHTYGLERAEVVGALFNVLFMYGIVAAIVISAIDRLLNPAPVQFGSVLVIGVIGLFVNILVAWLLQRGHKTLNTRGAMLHVMGDLLGSVAAIAAGLVIWLTGWMPIDPLLSLLICVLILVSSTKLLLETLHVVMEGTPACIDVGEVTTVLAAAHPDISRVHHVHIWTVSSDTRALSAHVDMRTMRGWNEVLHSLRKEVKRFGINHPTFQPLTSDSDSTGTADTS